MIGQVIDGHEVLRRLGVGGMGEVYLAGRPDGSLRAYKLVRTDRDASPQAAARFRREVLALGKLDHDGIVRIVDAGRLDGSQVYFGMEYVAGPDLTAAMGWDGPFSPADTVAILARIAGALAFAHAAGVVHRDLKPSNVILSDGEPARAKIIDFGLAKIAADEGLTRLTDDHDLLGSPLYWAPEQSNTAAVGPAADIYALGGIAYFLLSGEPMFRARPAVAMVYAHLHEVPPALASRCSEPLPAGLDPLIAACVAKDPAARPSAALLFEAFEEMRAATPPTVRVKRAQHLFTQTGLTNMGQAVTTQIRAVLLDLAEITGRGTDDIDRVQNELSELELDLAMIDSDAQISQDPNLVARRDTLSARVAELNGAVADAFRELFDSVVTKRGAGDVAPLFAELDALVEQYRSL